MGNHYGNGILVWPCSLEGFVLRGHASRGGNCFADGICRCAAGLNNALSIVICEMSRFGAR